MWTEAAVRYMMADHPDVRGVTIRDYVGGEGQAIRLEIAVPATGSSQDFIEMYRLVIDALSIDPQFTDVYQYIDQVRVYCYERRNERRRLQQRDQIAALDDQMQQPQRRIDFTFDVDREDREIEDAIFNDTLDNDDDNDNFN